MSGVRFSVVIPTRERAETLRFTLRTCLEQPFDDYEIVVSDNCSSPATKAVVEEFASPKIRYVRTSEPVAMSTNWEFAVSHARGEYVILLGDDDGLLPHGLVEIDRLARLHQANVIRWTAAFYTWPGIALPGQGDFLRVSLGSAVSFRESDEVIRAVASFRESYTELPMLYNSAVHCDLLDELRKRTGRVFPHPIPDVYSGFAIAHVAGRFLSTTVPMTVAGLSRASNGIAVLFNRGESEIDREFFALNAKAGLHSEPSVPDLPVFPHVPVADSFVGAKRLLFPNAEVSLDRRALAKVCVSGARVLESDWPLALATIRQSLADSPELQQWFDSELAGTPYHTPPPPQLRPAQLGFDGTSLNLDAAAFGVKDIVGAVRVCGQLLDYCARPVEYSTLDADLQLAAAKITTLTSGCDERDRANLPLHLNPNELLLKEVRLLKCICDERAEIIHRLDQHRQELTERIQELTERNRAERRWSCKRPLRAFKRAFTAITRLVRRGSDRP